MSVTAILLFSCFHFRRSAADAADCAADYFAEFSPLISPIFIFGDAAMSHC
jgi:hypothetical protein